MGWPPLALAARPHVKASLKPHSFSAIQRLASLPILDVSYLLYDPNDQPLLILPRALLLAGGLVGHQGWVRLGRRERLRLPALSRNRRNAPSLSNARHPLILPDQG